MLDIFKRYRLAQGIIMAIIRPWRSLILTILILFLTTYLLALIVYYNFSDFVDGVILYLTKKDICDAFFDCYMFILDMTFKSDGGFMSSDQYTIEYEKYTFIRYFNVINKNVQL